MDGHLGNVHTELNGDGSPNGEHEPRPRVVIRQLRRRRGAGSHLAFTLRFSWINAGMGTGDLS